MRPVEWLLAPLKARWQRQARARERAYWEPLLNTTKAQLKLCETIADEQTRRIAELKRINHG